MPDFSSFLDFLMNRGGQTLLNAAGGALQALGRSQTQNADRDAKNNRSLLRQLTQMRNQDQDRQLQASTTALNADPLGADQQFAQRNALRAAILPNVGPARSRAGDPAVALPQRTQAPLTFDPMTIANQYGPEATLRSITNRHRNQLDANPDSPLPDLSMFGDAAAPYVSELQQYQALRRQAAQDAVAPRNAAFDKALNWR